MPLGLRLDVGFHKGISGSFVGCLGLPSPKTDCPSVFLLNVELSWALSGLLGQKSF